MVEFRGPVTRDTYRAWYAQRTGIPARVEQDLMNDHFKHADWQYRLLSHSDVILRDFFSLTEYPRGIVIKYVNIDNPIHQVAAFVTLAKELQAKHPEFDFAGVTSVSVFSYLKKMKKSSTRDLDDQMNAWWTMYYKGSSGDLIAGIVLMISILYGDDVAAESIRKWVAADAPGEVVDLVEVVRNWETLKQYPMDWSVSLVNGSSNSDE